MRLNAPRVGVMLVLVLMLSLASAQSTAQDTFYKGSLKVALNKGIFNPGDALNARITASNIDATPIAQAYLVIELVQGGSYYYPSQTSDADNVFYETTIGNINLAPGEQRELQFSYEIPADIKGGSYRLDAYFKTRKTSIVGIPFIFASPVTARFEIENGTGDFPYVKILRTETKFHNTAGPIGPDIAPGSTIGNSIYVQNTSGRAMSNLKLEVMLCDWDDTSCDEIESEDSATFDLAADENKAIAISLTAPELTSAYAIRLEVKDSGNRLLSLYRNRSIVHGATARIRKLALNDYCFNSDAEVDLNFTMGPSPDHWHPEGNPVFRDFSLDVSVNNLRNNANVFKKSVAIKEISDKIGLLQESLSFNAPADMDYFEVCSVISKEGTRYDSYCTTIDAEKFALAEQPPELMTEWIYNESTKSLSIEFCREVQDKFCAKYKKPATSLISGNYAIADSATMQAIASKSFSGENCITEKIEGLSQKNYLLTVNDTEGKRQYNKVLELGRKSCPELKGIVCGADSACKGNEVDAGDAANCCIGACEPKEEPIPPGKPEIKAEWLWVFLGIIVILIAAGLLLRREKEKTAG